jgi:anti-sigma regulatory factor (Ser/Thr protein kinase)
LRRPVELSRQPAVARRELARILDDTDWPGDTDAAVLAVHEAMVNSQRHGGGVTRATAGFDGPALVVQISDQGEGFEVPESPELVDTTAERGRGFDIPESPELIDTAAERGRGLFLIRHLASDARVVRSGNEVQLVLTFGA